MHFGGVGKGEGLSTGYFVIPEKAADHFIKIIANVLARKLCNITFLDYTEIFVLQIFFVHVAAYLGLQAFVIVIEMQTLWATWYKLKAYLYPILIRFHELPTLSVAYTTCV